MNIWREAEAASRKTKDGEISALPTGASETEKVYLVDLACSHMLVSKIKPCMSKYKLLVK